MNYQYVTIFLFDSKISDHNTTNKVQKMMIDGKWVDRIGINEKDVSEPGFKKINDVRNIIRT